MSIVRLVLFGVSTTRGCGLNGGMLYMTLIPQSSFATLTGIGHLPQLEVPNTLVEILIELLEGM